MHYSIPSTRYGDPSDTPEKFFEITGLRLGDEVEIRYRDNSWYPGILSVIYSETPDDGEFDIGVDTIDLDTNTIPGPYGGNLDGRLTSCTGIWSGVGNYGKVRPLEPSAPINLDRLYEILGG